jgi:hypothetical protein
MNLLLRFRNRPAGRGSDIRHALQVLDSEALKVVQGGSLTGYNVASQLQGLRTPTPQQVIRFYILEREELDRLKFQIFNNFFFDRGLPGGGIGGPP